MTRRLRVEVLWTPVGADPHARREAGWRLRDLLLARRLGVPQARLPAPVRSCEWCGGPHGRPRLPSGAVQFSTSRAPDGQGGWVVAVAATDARWWGRVPAIGLDLVGPCGDVPRPADVFSPRELESGPATGLAGVRRAFARKESVLKAAGCGLAVPLSAVTVTGARGGSGEWVARLPRVPSLRGQDVAVGSCVGAVAVLGSRWGRRPRVAAEVRRHDLC